MQVWRQSVRALGLFALSDRVGESVPAVDQIDRERREQIIFSSSK